MRDGADHVVDSAWHGLRDGGSPCQAADRVLLAAIAALDVLLPLSGLSLLIVLALDQLLIRRGPRLRRFFRTA
ncbi:hypothetical protein C3B60_14110 [Cryobacterium zongtaii]|nr:hypothetical protein C3B60_14110 [Cryobacterium zongtaii]